MRTTLTIGDALYAEAKARAARTGQSVGSFIEDALREYLRIGQPGQVTELPTIRTAGPLPGIDLDDMSSVLERIDEGLPLDAVR